MSREQRRQVLAQQLASGEWPATPQPDARDPGSETPSVLFEDEQEDTYTSEDRTPISDLDCVDSDNDDV